MEISVAVFQHFRLTLIEQYYSAPDTANVQRLVVLIQHQYALVEYHDNPLESIRSDSFNSPAQDTPKKV